MASSNLVFLLQDALLKGLYKTPIPPQYAAGDASDPTGSHGKECRTFVCVGVGLGPILRGPLNKSAVLPIAPEEVVLWIEAQTHDLLRVALQRHNLVQSSRTKDVDQFALRSCQHVTAICKADQLDSSDRELLEGLQVPHQNVKEPKLLREGHGHKIAEGVQRHCHRVFAREVRLQLADPRGIVPNTECAVLEANGCRQWPLHSDV
mmetsp:Transcript_62383/g.101018  ORF Transcript_62383/g.101018 Transcript_62383/m.101018 type:complete len:206 (+) Transcript_62383:165-782(+)